jgi:hypothetical protein
VFRWDSTGKRPPGISGPSSLDQIAIVSPPISDRHFFVGSDPQQIRTSQYSTPSSITLQPILQFSRNSRQSSILSTMANVSDLVCYATIWSITDTNPYQPARGIYKYGARFHHVFQDLTAPGAMLISDTVPSSGEILSS